MVAQAWTQRTVVALFPKYIYGRFFGHDEKRIAQQAGVSVDAITLGRLGSLAYAPMIAKNNISSVARYRWRTPYISTDPWTPLWNELVATGFAMPAGEGWSLTERGTSLCDQVHREARRFLESHNLAAADLNGLTATVTSLADGIPSDAEIAMCAHRGLPLQEEIRSDIVRADRAISELWNFRDDSHIAAWQAAGYSGPTLDVMSQVWEGINTIDEVASELEGRQERTDVERQVDMLVESGDIERNADLVTLTTQGQDRRDSIEHDTDARYFRGWPWGDDLRRMGDDLAALIAALP